MLVVVQAAAAEDSPGGKERPGTWKGLWAVQPWQGTPPDPLPSWAPATHQPTVQGEKAPTTPDPWATFSLAGTHCPQGHHHCSGDPPKPRPPCSPSHPSFAISCVHCRWYLSRNKGACRSVRHCWRRQGC